MGAYDPLSAGFTDKRFGGKGAFDPLSAGFTDKRFGGSRGAFDPLSAGFTDKRSKPLRAAGYHDSSSLHPPVSIGMPRSSPPLALASSSLA